MDFVWPFHPWAGAPGEMILPGELPVISPHHLKTPKASVQAIAGAVQYYSNNLVLHSVLGHAGSHMGVVVLHPGMPACFKFRGYIVRQPRGHVRRVKIAGYNPGFKPVKLQRFFILSAKFS